jgi:hypothetical protein
VRGWVGAGWGWVGARRSEARWWCYRPSARGPRVQALRQSRSGPRGGACDPPLDTHEEPALVMDSHDTSAVRILLTHRSSATAALWVGKGWVWEARNICVSQWISVSMTISLHLCIDVNICVSMRVSVYLRASLCLSLCLRLSVYQCAIRTQEGEAVQPQDRTAAEASCTSALMGRSAKLKRNDGQLRLQVDRQIDR